MPIRILSFFKKLCQNRVDATKEKATAIIQISFCKFIWYIFILQALFIIYNIAPKPLPPLVTVDSSFAKLYGPNVIEEGKTSTTYMVKVTKDLRQDLNITLQYSGTAKDGEDFIGVKNIIIKKGKFTQSFVIKTLDDPFAEGEELFAIKIKSITGVSFLKAFDISDEAGVIFTKIIDEKAPKYKDNGTVSITINGKKTIAENNQKNKYTLKLSQKAPQDIDLHLAFSGTALYGVDYDMPKDLKILKGDDSITFELNTIDDIFNEENETIKINIIGLDDIGFEDIRYKTSQIKVLLKDEKKPSVDIPLYLSVANNVSEDSKIIYTLFTDAPVKEDIVVHFKLQTFDIAKYDDTIAIKIKKGQKKVFIN